MRAALRESGWHQPISDVRSMQERIDTVYGKVRLNSLLTTIFASHRAGSCRGWDLRRHLVLGGSADQGDWHSHGAGRHADATYFAGFLAKRWLWQRPGSPSEWPGNSRYRACSRSLLYGTSTNDVFTWIGAAVILAIGSRRRRLRSGKACHPRRCHDCIACRVTIRLPRKIWNPGPCAMRSIQQER